MRKRIDFPAPVKRVIAERVNYHCSSPICRVGTTGPRVDSARSLMLGVAAHITAASPRGPRYDPNMSDAERRAASNGIWLCQNCAKLVDNDEERYSTDILRRWKQVAELFALNRIGSAPLFGRESAPHIDVLMIPHHEGVAYTPSESNSFDPRALFEHPPTPDAMVEVLARGTNALRLPFVVVGVSDKYGWDWEVIYFVASESGWHPNASIKLEGQKGRRPSVDYLSGLPGGLLLHHVAGAGTGLFRTDYSLYRIGARKGEPILNFPSYLHVVGWGMPFDRHLKLLSLSNPSALARGAALQLKYRLQYEIDAQENPQYGALPLLDYEFNLKLIWDERSEQFVPAGPDDDFAFLDTIWNEGTDGFVRRCREGLLSLAETGTDEQKKFVERYVK